jgi:hypothetical protein
MNMSENATSNAQANMGEMQDDYEISLLDLLQVVVIILRLLVMGSLVMGSLVCCLAALGISFTISPIFTAKTQLLQPHQQQSFTAIMFLRWEPWAAWLAQPQALIAPLINKMYS